ncbi:hypothetical protein TAL182_PE00374 (plasmid) [Rhizobium sp. TAL182]|nr:hypothetical protein TAL182_PE00374 [Rhizobium sp. TAL182]
MRDTSHRAPPSATGTRPAALILSAASTISSQDCGTERAGFCRRNYPLCAGMIRIARRKLQRRRRRSDLLIF